MISSEERELRKVLASRALGIIKRRGFDGAQTGRRASGWVTASTSADAEILPSLSKLRDRSRDLVRNNPYAAKGLRVFVSNAIGTGIIPNFNSSVLAALYEQWKKECDADGQLDFCGLQKLAGRTIPESGECLVRFRYRRPEDGLTVPLQLQVLETDYIDNSKNEQLKNGAYIQNGIEYDAIGQRAAYWLFSEHPGSNSVKLRSLQSKRIDAEDIIHVYEKLRPGQSRGYPIFTPVMMTQNDLDEYEEATLVRKAAEACITAVVRTDDEDASIGSKSTEEDSTRILEELAPGMVQYLNTGEDIVFNNPQASTGYTEYVNTRLHAIAAGMGITYEQMTGDLSQVNYSSIRAGTLDFRREIEQFQKLTFIPMFLDKVMEKWLSVASLVRRVPKNVNVTWTTPKWDWVDPVKDVSGEEKELELNLKSWSKTVRERGQNPEDVLKEIAAEKAMFEKAGLTYPLDRALRQAITQQPTN